ncbi:MAG: preprotein translocase subunit YajC [Duncaniella sp.]|uniref:preprotein translocase subunit YajC n=1 Tax=Duncaniella sp. TaxID=2518496 RepID=UPI001990A1CA|nr:preprotein translocase subunit YajC [Duncaniella sp.]MBD5314330.1 preprotein translocase subunit YajC [Bacteroides sp.]MDE6089706.1 preprotein translocase subunit YajC [Duncaniella sp.]
MLTSILLQGNGAGWANILMIVALIAVFYFMMIRPQQKRQNEIKKFREGLRVNDPVVTAGGIYGKIKSIDDTTFVVEIAKDVRITIDKGSVYPSAQQAMRDAAEKENKQ